MGVILYSVKAIFFALLVAGSSFIGSMFGHTFATLLGLGDAEFLKLPTTINGIAPFLIITTLIAIVVGELFKKLRQASFERFICIFLYHYYFFYGIHMFDKFAREIEFVLFYELVSSLFPALIFSLLVTVLWKPKEVTTSFWQQSDLYFKNGSLAGWLLKIVGGWLIFVVVFYFANLLISPFLEQYDSTITLDLQSMMAIELAAGIIFIIVSLPIFIRWKESKTTLLFWAGFPVFLQVAVYPAVAEFWLPIGIRFPYLIQYTVITFLIAIIYVQLFYVPKENEVIEDQFNWLY